MTFALLDTTDSRSRTSETRKKFFGIVHWCLVLPETKTPSIFILNGCKNRPKSSGVTASRSLDRLRLDGGFRSRRLLTARSGTLQACHKAVALLFPPRFFRMDVCTKNDIHKTFLLDKMEVLSSKACVKRAQLKAL